jgi:hypothetical protein
VVGRSLAEFFRAQTLFRESVELFGDESVLCGDGEVSHGEVEQLTHDYLISEGLLAVGLRLRGAHFDDLADGVVAHVFLYAVADLPAHLVLVPLAEEVASQSQVEADLSGSCLLPEQPHSPQQLG